MQKNPFKSWKMHSIVDLVPATPPPYDRHAAAVLVRGAAGALVRRAAAAAVVAWHWRVECHFWQGLWGAEYRMKKKIQGNCEHE